MVEGKEHLSMNLTECNVRVVKVTETVHAYTTASLLKVLAADLAAQRGRVEDACSEDEAARPRR